MAQGLIPVAQALLPVVQELFLVAQALILVAQELFVLVAQELIYSCDARISSCAASITSCGTKSSSCAARIMWRGILFDGMVRYSVRPYPQFCQHWVALTLPKRSLRISGVGVCALANPKSPRGSNKQGLCVALQCIALYCLAPNMYTLTYRTSPNSPTPSPNQSRRTRCLAT